MKKLNTIQISSEINWKTTFYNTYYYTNNYSFQKVNFIPLTFVCHKSQGTFDKKTTKT